MKKLNFLLMLVLCFSMLTENAFAQSGKAKKVEIKVMYFHGPMRCQSCIIIENEIKSTMKNIFEKEQKDGSVTLSIIDFHADENEHYIDKYKLETQTLIIARYENGKETSWKDLDKIWTYGGNSKKFETYLTSEIRKLSRGR